VYKLILIQKLIDTNSIPTISKNRPKFFIQYPIEFPSKIQYQSTSYFSYPEKPVLSEKPEPVLKNRTRPVETISNFEVVRIRT